MSPYAYLDQLADALEPGAGGLIALDYWLGNRTPIRDPLARGALVGLTLYHTPAHIYSRFPGSGRVRQLPHHRDLSRSRRSDRRDQSPLGEVPEEPGVAANACGRVRLSYHFNLQLRCDAGWERDCGGSVRWRLY